MKKYNERIEKVRRLIVVVEDNEKELEQRRHVPDFHGKSWTRYYGEIDGTLVLLQGNKSCRDGAGHR